MLSVTILISLIVFIIIFSLFQRSLPILTSQPLGTLLLSSTWNPLVGNFGFYPFIAGTIWVTLLAMAISIPPSILTSIYLAEYASNRLQGIIKPLIDLLAGIPSVIFGLLGVLIIVPFIRNNLAPLLGVSTTGYSLLAGSMVLAIMVFPIIISVSTEIIKAVPQAPIKASLALGATKWQTVKHVILPSSLSGLSAAIILGFGRAFGETIAVLMVVGNVPKAPSSIFSPAYPLPALIANNFGDMMSVPSYDSALMFAALILLVIVIVFSVIAEIVLTKIKKA
jgi:phosphate transport system permease protein